MITAAMQLNTATDSDQWADSLLEGISSTDYDIDFAIELLSAWLWSNKPNIGCVYSDHLISGIGDLSLWAIIEKAEIPA